MTIVRKSLLLCCVITLSFFGFMSISKASIINAGEIKIMESNRLFAPASDGVCGMQGSECQSYFGDPNDIDCTAYWLQWILNIIKYIAIGALLILCTFDFIKALVQNDKDALKKAGTTAIKRFIFVVILFFLPIIVEFIMSLFGAYGTCGIG